ncbi:hypothetical protein SLAV_30705 [Streptomyces lavendulae subsp. lavendulae]|uniref:Uncharacterized protein n=1 Tax=Streptomyces lavendulae subsp. lavendulae TaxID=58340 RepID=A0A2K8PN62_STRLA|nr:hypothetical protein [Streptomyces lavendulae]ATZ27918.1 hypothetical protein SLAV_30705 [Streptomyces lavendulae subsp. lavendulae]QUQ57745.1 hypothetical protein SLLC_28865 [Streptomyces lavendulae subsp. lavendulae]
MTRPRPRPAGAGTGTRRPAPEPGPRTAPTASAPGPGRSGAVPPRGRALPQTGRRPRAATPTAPTPHRTAEETYQ